MKTRKNKKLTTELLLTVIFVIIIAIGGFIIWNNIEKYKQAQQSINNTQTLANPASVYCAEKGGKNVIQTNSSGGQYGLCQFDDNMACEEWAMYRGDCPIGGIKTTGYDNIQQMYCAWSGGQTLAVENATCSLPDGNVCPVDAYYAGTCPNY